MTQSVELLQTELPKEMARECHPVGKSISLEGLSSQIPESLYLYTSSLRKNRYRDEGNFVND